jgi:hypothetical protein
MDAQSRTALARLAEDQRGLFATAQAAELGVSPRQLARIASRGYLRRVRRGVYAVAGTPRSRWEEILAAALAAGKVAVISHSSAAAVHRLGTAGPGLPELTVGQSCNLRLAAVVVHRRAQLPTEDLVARYGASITSPARTLVDMAGRLNATLLEQTMDEGLVAHIWDVTEVRASLARAAPNTPGRARLERLLLLRAETPPADSLLESRIYRALQALAPYRAHYVTEAAERTFVLDAAWPDHRVGAEIVGRAHRVVSRSAFDRERRKLNTLTAAGWRIAHLTAAMSDNEVTATVRSLLVLGA